MTTATATRTRLDLVGLPRWAPGFRDFRAALPAGGPDTWLSACFPHQGWNVMRASNLWRGEGCGKHESCNEDSANYCGHPKRNSQRSRRGAFDVHDRTGRLAKFE